MRSIASGTADGPVTAIPAGAATVPLPPTEGPAMDVDAELERRRQPTSVEDLVALRTALADHLALVSATADEHQHVQADLARDLVASFTTVIDEVDMDDDGRSLLRSAIDYFLQPHDAEDDLASPIGLEDDAFIANTVFERLGRDDLVVSAI